MFKSLLLIGSALTGLSSSVYSNVVEANGIKVTYKYSTNEILNDGDLIVGNTYLLSWNLIVNDVDSGANNFDLLSNGDEGTNIFTINDFYTNAVFYELNIETYNIDYGVFTLQVYNQQGIFNIFITDDNNDVSYQLSSDTSAIGIGTYLNYLILTYNGGSSDTINSYVWNNSLLTALPNELNPIESVERVYPQNIFGNVSEFIDEYILSGIPLIDSVSNTINGTNVTLRAWLNTSICIVLAIFLLSLLVIFVKWLFKMFAGLISR